MYVTKRSGFAMILAIFVVVLIALGGVLLMRGSTQESKAVGDKYLRAQAQLLASSATEYAVMRVQGFNTATNCLNQLNITVYNSNGATAGNEMFDVNVSLAYSFRGAAPTACTILAFDTQKDSTVLVDVIVTDRNLSTESIRIHQRSWQTF